MNDVYLLTGGNIGNRLAYLQKAYELIETRAGSVTKKSRIYETAAWGVTNQQPFLNQALCISTLMDPEKLLETLLAIEIQLGRQRVEKMGPRVIDIDVLFYDDIILSLPHLTIPHPRIAERRFVLTPLNEIAPYYVHPVFEKPVKELLQECKDELAVNVYAPAM